MVERKLQAGIVGYGFIGELHGQVLRENPNIQSITAFDPDAERRGIAETQPHTRAVSNLQELLQDALDIIVVASPPAQALQVVQEILSHDPRPQALLIEKPLATTLSDARKIEQIAGQQDTMAQAGLTGRFHPEFQRAHELIQAGTIGEILSFSERLYLGGPELPRRYLTDQYGGVVLLNGIHTFDHLRFLTGFSDWQIVAALLGDDNWHEQCPDWGQAMATSGAVSAHMSWLWPKTFPTSLKDYRVDLIGTQGWLSILGFDSVEYQTQEGGGSKNSEKFHADTDSLPIRHLPGLRAQMNALISAVFNQQASPVALSEAIAAQELIEQTYTVSGWSLRK